MLGGQIDWPATNATIAAGTHVTRVATATATALAHSTGVRRGTAANVARIEPVPYSPVIINAPSTPIASCASCTPARLTLVGSNPARSAAPTGGRATRTIE
ncbi:hypothetical protein [Parafrankia sp. BMG5.11]|uniref:hypothetical protein n=1 Tax=Parafrankia sp. BMG5.11 TaxID=222540 RepID=UPI00103E7F60|nr:hypothetical protein [Parafrankia sp. BMG5.11]TCJ31350.1 hypothetical protein E0504_49170 [Parafrankia sp. BMG5.11]